MARCSGNTDDEDMEDINRPMEETCTIGRGSLSHHAAHSNPDGTVYMPQHGVSPSTPHDDTPSPLVHVLSAQLGTIPSSSHHFTQSPPGYVYPHEHGIIPFSSHHATPSPSAHPTHSPRVGDKHTSTSRDFISEELQISFAIYEAWCREAAIRYTGNIYLIANKKITPIYLTEEVFEHYKRKRAKDEAFKKKSEQMSANRKFEVGGPGTGISLHSAGTISARQNGDTLKEMSTQSTDTSIDEDAVYLELVPEVKGRVYELRSQGYHRIISSREASSSRRPAYWPYELEELQRDHQKLQETLLKERME
ncbi:hypothetical protein Syun_026026 [Stephania yunnanensis]|uniref:Uncharacterized protein n=1 Tax=Stephania yunnanensis TaxID=152371 RepID=A0AAP0ETI5_9MAGN